MKKSNYVWIIIVLAIIIGIIIYFYVSNADNTNNDSGMVNNEVTAERTSTNINNENIRN